MSTARKSLASVFALAMALILVIGLAPFATSSTALADTTTSHTITINEPTGQKATHTYEAYQVFSGTYDSTSKQLQSITWGNGVDGDALLAALKADSTLGSAFADATDAPTAAAAMAKLTDSQTAAMAKIVAQHLGTTKATSADNKVTVTGDGYYFLKDVTEEANIGSDTYSKYMLKVVGDETITAKDTTTTSEKFVKEKNDSTGTETDWQKVADYDMGDQVPFELVGTIANDYGDYTTYEFSFVDTYNKTQFGDPQNVTIKVDGTAVSQDELTAAGYKLSTTDDGFTISFTDLKKITEVKAGSKITAEYTAELLTTANIGSTGNKNTSHITFSNDSNQSGHKGKTPDDTVIVFTYQTVVNKVNEQQQSLDGAGFTLYKKGADGNYTAVGNELKTGHQFTFKGLDAGDYKLVETTVPAGYNKMDDIEFSITSTLDNTNKALTALSGDVTSGTATFTANTDDGSLATTVVNKSGSTLPSTGGMGTTILYIVGAAIIAAAGYGLYRRSRSRKNNA
ncbi:MAG: SpaA isopeptide-forming pilin-related protein [Eggerthellaceae bacterium]|jgi:fimbrial isopeptide formation D2 family protein/LPXTG-motif cell wall-anchored protein